MSTLLVPARYYARLSEILPHHGVDPQRLLDTAGISITTLLQPDGRLPLSDVERLVAALIATDAPSEIPFALGKLLSVSAHSVVGFGMLSSPTLDDAMRFVARYFRLVMPSFRMRYSSTPNSGELLFTPAVAMSRACLEFHLEVIAMAALRDIEDLTGGARPPTRLNLSIPIPPHRRLYDTLSRVETRFAASGAPHARLELHADPRARPIRLADPNALKVAEQRCSALIHHVAEVRRLSEWIEMTIREMGEGVPTLGELSQMLNLSTRTLNRYLNREGTNYRKLAGAMQFELACERLTRSAQSITEIAYVLGFADPANFTRAFRARAGCSPKTYQQRMRLTDPDAPLPPPV
ncbi:AraC family transcriptional regulator [Sinimarinibacterium sp. NLF-5-8]|uniref:AraC family transcriptional regulator n=1 Tax=Sinimarinibacterium sp. NLF-5-8 TaxID=2698684 RepID=UPI00137C1D86|nr:AraC family transcriptional regulator [Sinimarinibacterium sp. NLF-5-8]QHS10456.1 AraC family transcriptional regulator [Sinimarinibacterium sp. NLF-5-8]